jgi:AraC family transcriptional regulator of adaptative response / DNA-3-methyladenine glycosylase II
LALRLQFPPPLDWDGMLACLKDCAIPGVEHVTGSSYQRTIEVEGYPGVLELWPGGPDHVLLRAHLPHWRGLIHFAQRARTILNLDANVEAAMEQLDPDPIVGPLTRQRPGLRPVGSWDPFEAGVRAIVGQFVGEAGASAITGGIVKRLGVAVPGLVSLGLTHLFPPASALAAADLGGLGVAPIGATAIKKFASAVADNTLSLDRDRELEDLLESIAAIPGVNLNTAHQIAMRIGDSDAFPASTETIRRWVSRATANPISRRDANELANSWRPYRALAATYLASATGPQRVERRMRNTSSG